MPRSAGLLVKLESGGGARVTGDPDNPDSRGSCVRAQAAPEILDNPGRLLHTLVRATGADPGVAQPGTKRSTGSSRACGGGSRRRGAWSGHGIFANNYGGDLLAPCCGG